VLEICYDVKYSYNVGGFMGDFQWLHFSDLHLSADENAHKAYARNMLISFLESKYNNDPDFCDYVFITGDIADRGQYERTEDFIHDLLKAIGMSESPDKVFWAVGNHDLNLECKERELIIENIRSAGDIEAQADRFFSAMANNYEKNTLTGTCMRTYRDMHNKLFNRSLPADDPFYPHVRVDTLDDLNLIMLNTCLTSLKNNDEGNLHIYEDGLHDVFKGLEKSKPTFVIGHHGMKFLAEPSQEFLRTLYDKNNVDIYLCGHSHELGFANFSNAGRHIHQYTSGSGCVLGGGTAISFMHGKYFSKTGDVSIAPYSYSATKMEWNRFDTLERIPGVEKPLKLTGVVISAADNVPERTPPEPVNEKKDYFFKKTLPIVLAVISYIVVAVAGAFISYFFNIPSRQNEPEKPEVARIAMPYVSSVIKSNGIDEDTLYEEGERYYFEKKYDEAMEKYKEAAIGHHRESLYRLGYMYETGQVYGKPDFETALAWYTQAADSGHVLSQLKVGEFYFEGKGTTAQNYAKAIELFTQAAEQDNVMAQFYLGICYDTHNAEFGVEGNEDIAEEWYTKAANRGNAAAQNKLGWLLYKRKADAKEASAAFRWFEMAAEKGIPDALYGMGLCYYFGLGVSEKDQVKAFELISEAAVLNVSDAQKLLDNEAYKYDIAIIRKQPLCYWGRIG